MTTTVAVRGSRPATVGSRLLTAVRDIARSAPDRVALCTAEDAVTYGDLWHRAEETARTLGDRPGIVGVPALHEPGTVVALLGVWAAGGTYCPVDPSFPREHVDALLGDVGARHLGDIGRTPADTRGPVDESTAYVLFTSGSTGRPKPVTVPHRALEVVVPALGELFGITPDDRVLQFASLNWDTAFEEILPTLAAGACVVFDPDAHTGSLPRLLRMLERQQVSALDLPTAFWHELVLHLSESGTGLPDCVRLVVIGGEAVSPSRLEAWHRLPGADRIRLLNTYGATETTMVTHAVDLRRPTSGAGPNGDGNGSTSYDAPPIGRPLAHVVQRVTDAGELLVGGPGLATGYAGHPQASAERFLQIDGDTFFSTGDLVRESADGLMHHLGRLDAQVKVRGIRVDPGEVEAHLARCPLVAAAAVTGVTVSGRTVLAAYVVPAASPPDGSTLVGEIRQFLRARTPGHLHPARITAVPRLVLTPSGKVDRRATHARYGPPSPPTAPCPTAEESRS